MSKVAVVTGSNKGLGYAIVKALCQTFDGIVYLTSRNEERGNKAVEELKSAGLKPHYHKLDVTCKESIENFRDYLQATYGGINIIINNAAISDSDLHNNSYEDSKNVIDNNYKSLLYMQGIIFPLVKEGGRILNISSSAGHLACVRNEHWIQKLSKTDLTVEEVNEFVDWFLNSKKNGTYKAEDFADNGTVSAYRVSKIAICALTIIQQKLFNAKNISINCLHPGLVRTDLTRGLGFLTPDQAAETAIYLVLEAPQTLKGEYVWFDKKLIDWYDSKSDLYFKVSEFEN